MAEPTRRPKEPFPGRTTLKLIVIATLAAVLLIPLSLLRPIVDERREARDGAVADIQGRWGAKQVLFGPVLVLPLATPGRVAYVFPEELEIDGKLVPDRRARGIYDAVVYTAAVKISGTFVRPDARDLGVEPGQLRWDEAYLSLSVPDLRGVDDAVILTWDQKPTPLLPGARFDPWLSGLHAPVAPPAGKVSFALDLSLRGSRGLYFVAAGARTQATLRSSWPHPSFDGSFLPATRAVDDGGFTATWRTSQYGLKMARAGVAPPAVTDVDASLFGVELMLGIDTYRSVERATKYGVLFIALLFLSFFLFEVLAGARIHPVQYGMVGLALAVFFLLLLALSEVVVFAAAYAIAAGATTAAISLYTVSVLKTGRRSLAIAGKLCASFALLYVILQAEDYALLAGSVTLFGALAATMALTRRVAWYPADEDDDEKPPAVTPPAAS